jgi:Domain of unknown function (DUF1996)
MQKIAWPRHAGLLIAGSVTLLAVAAAACRPLPPPPDSSASPSQPVAHPPHPTDPHPTDPHPTVPPTGGPTAGPTSSHHGSGVAFDPHKIPPGSAGSPAERVRNTGEMPTPSGDGVGNFRTVCTYSHMNTDDPIVFPNQPGMSHLHVFWGNTKVDARSTAGSIRTTGNGTCRGGTINRTGYWAPAVIDTSTGAPIAPELIHVYYKSGYRGVPPGAVKPMPPGLRMVAGNPKASGPQDHMGWKCWNAGGSGVPTIPRCGVGDFVTMTVDFPQCWNGHDIDSADHRAHMAYAVPGHGCPASHPVPLPVISFNVLYPVTRTSNIGAWRLSSDTYEGKPAGYSVHGDWFDGWKQDIVESWIKGCVNRPVSCGSHMIGDGRVMDGDR